MKNLLPANLLPVALLALAGGMLAACLGLGNEVLTESSVPAAPLAVERPAAPETGPGAAQVRLAAQRALPYLEEHGVTWMKQQKCASCHQVPSMIWSFNEAAAHGLDVDRDKLAEWNRWTIADSEETGVSNADGIHQLILGRPRSAGDPVRREYEALAKYLAQAQEADGSWQAGGQLPLQRRPADESHRVSTVWSMLALASIDEPSDALERAHELLGTCLSEAGQSHEWLVVRLLYEDRFGDRDKARELAGELLAEQNPDGGWAWMRGEPSDAFATGQSLYALERVGLTDDAAVARARGFLLETQQDDGSWIVRSTLKREHGPVPTSSYWGTGWAVIGLLRTLPAAGPQLRAQG